ncbi:MAG: cobyrinate a,c-diamide synthase [Deltaproteobacteria bacterium]|nr:cobyrinate a,c-diamide synthase [Deltaproteobacteria bacterium]
MKGIVVAGTQSGSGKTTLTLAILAALMRRGFRVVSFKVGPDFIDPGHHTRITGSACRNLDGWMLSKSCNQKIFSHHIQSADLAVVEGVMGLFDGYDGKSEAGSTAQMAKWLNLPVLLAVNAKSMARSAAAVVYGFEKFDPDLRFSGVIFNQLGSARHLNYLKEALSDHVQMPCLGGLLKNADIAIPERHLGLVTLQDHPLSPSAINLLADFIESSVDMDALLASFSDIHADQETAPSPRPPESVRVKIGVAMDQAFCFYYPDNLDALAAAGAELVPFSPIADSSLPEELGGIYLGGGYPELHAEKLAANSQLRFQILASSLKGMPIYAECGGLMYLCTELTDMDGRNHPMTGCFSFSTRMLKRLKTLGYREITLKKNTILGQAGQKIRGHEFHYSEIIPAVEVPGVYAVTSRFDESETEEGFQVNNTLGSYIHLHFGSQPKAATAFVQACLQHCYPLPITQQEHHDPQ